MYTGAKLRYLFVSSQFCLCFFVKLTALLLFMHHSGVAFIEKQHYFDRKATTSTEKQHLPNGKKT